MEDQTRPEQASAEVQARVRASFDRQGLMRHLGARIAHVAPGRVLTVEYKVNLLAPAEGDHLEAVGTVLKSGRTLAVCQLEVFGVRGSQRSLVATGQQTLIRVNGRPEQ